LLVDVAEGDRDVYSALDSSFDIEQVDLEGREAKRFLSISHLPPILQIQVQRVQYDRAKASAYKSNSHLKFPDTIYLDRYMETDDPDLKAKREESWVWKEELKALEQRLAELTKTRVRIPWLILLGWYDCAPRLGSASPRPSNILTNGFLSSILTSTR